MTQSPVLKNGLNALLTPEESVLVLIDHQAFHAGLLQGIDDPGDLGGGRFGEAGDPDVGDLAFGIDPKVLGLDRHIVSTSSVLQKLSL